MKTKHLFNFMNVYFEITHNFAKSGMHMTTLLSAGTGT